MKHISLIKHKPLIISSVLALGASFIVWKALELIFPCDPIALLSLKRTASDYDIMRWATGLAFFVIVSVAFSIFSEQNNNRYNSITHQNVSSLPPQSKILDIFAFASRIAVAGYFFMFWSNYVSYVWFKRIGLIIGNLTMEFWGAFISVILVNVLSVYIIVKEPWRTLVNRVNIMWIVRLGTYVFISLPFYFLGTVNFLFDIPVVVFIALSFVAVFIAFIIWRNHQIH